MTMLASADTPKCGVYFLHLGNDHMYVGSSIDVPRRLRKHSSALATGRHINPKMQAVFNKHGVFEVTGVEASDSPRELEQTYLDNCREIFDLNLSDSTRTPFDDPEIRARAVASGRTPEARARASARMKADMQSGAHDMEALHRANRRPVVDTQTSITYSSAAEAAKAAGITASAVHKQCHANIEASRFRYVGAPAPRSSRHVIKPVIDTQTSITYPSATEAAKAAGLGVSAVSAQCCNNIQGARFRHVGAPAPRANKRVKSVIDTETGTAYPSIVVAARAAGVTEHCMVHRCTKAKRSQRWRFAETE